MQRMLIIMIAAFACSPQSNEELIKKNIRSYLSKSMHDYNSYEAVDFGKIDTAYTDYSENPRYQSLMDSVKTYGELSDKMLEAARQSIYSSKTASRSYLNQADRYNKIADSINKIIEKENNSFKPVFKGYSIVHSFRGKNPNGALVLTDKKFFLDSNFHVVKSVSIK